MCDQNILKIRTLGEFSIEYGDNILSDNGSRSKKLWMLLEYLVAFRGQSISQNEMIELLWQSEDKNDPANALKAIIHRIRTMLNQLGLDGKKLITNQRGGYTLNHDGIQIEVDSDIFEKLCEQAEHAPDEQTRLDCLLKALEIYRGNYLPQTALESWAVPISTYFHMKYVSAAREAVRLLEERNRYKEVVAICQKVVMIDPYQEDILISFIRALAKVGQTNDAVAQYERSTEMFYSQFGVTPSPEFYALYKDLTRTSDAVVQDLTVIREGFKEIPDPRAPGAFPCELEVFKDIYRLELRAQERSGQVFCLCLLTVSATTGTRLTQKLVNSSMEKLSDAVRFVLRQNDVFTRYSVSQYLLLLMGTTLEDAGPVAERILKRFRAVSPNAPVAIHYRLQPIGEAMMERA